MIITNTDLEYTEADKISLKYNLGSDNGIQEWGYRIYSLCNEYKNTNGIGNNPSEYPGGMPRVYKRNYKDLWEEKKIVSRDELIKNFNGQHLNDDENHFLQDIQKQTSLGNSIQWSESHSDDVVIAIGQRSDYQSLFEV